MPPNALTLKQRLSALALAPSSPSAPHSSDPMSPKSPRRRPLFNSPWARRNTLDSLDPMDPCMDRIEQVMNKLIFQAGVDYETRPMVVISASALPDPKEVSYDLLLVRILSYLNLYVESDYTVVFLAAGGRHTPGWNWLWKAYRSLSRKYRKNLKRLYIVHSTFFSKMLFSLAGAIISPKFFRKIEYIDTLSDLAYHIPITQIDIPPAVYQENTKFEREIRLPHTTRADLFGVPLEDLMGYDAEKGGIPRVVKDCIQYIREHGLEEDGLFRRSPQSALLRQVKEAYDRGHVVNLDTYADPHLAAVLIKKYLRDLPDALFPESLYPLIRKCPPPKDDQGSISATEYVREVLFPELPNCVYVLLSHVLHLMHEVSLRSAVNRMDAHNLAVVLCPNLVKGSNPARDVMMCAVPGGPAFFDPGPAPASPNNSMSMEGKTTLGAIVKLCIERYYEVFDEVCDRSEAIIPTDQQQQQDLSSTSASTSSLGSNGQRHSRHQDQDDDEEIDDAILVMPIGPSSSAPGQLADGKGPASPPGPPSAWASSPATIAYRPRQKPTRSVNTVFGVPATGTTSGLPNAYGTIGKNKARSMISIEKTSGGETASRRGSISVGRGTLRKSAGSGVAAMGITASGFFTPPASAPPVPKVSNGGSFPS